MEFIIAIFMYLGLITSPAEVTQAMIDRNADTIEQYQDDKDFLDYYHNQDDYSSTESIGLIDINDGN